MASSTSLTCLLLSLWTACSAGWLLAAEAVVKLFVWTDRERWRLLVVKRAEPGIVLACLFQGHAAFDDINNVDAGQQIVNERLGYATGHGQDQFEVW